MTAILGYADVMLEEDIAPKIREHVEIIKQNGKHLLEIINDILDMSKVEAGKMQIERVHCSPSELLCEVVSMMRVRADTKHLDLKMEFAGPIPETVSTDPLRFRQILVNLVGNAIKFTEKGDVCVKAQLTKKEGKSLLRVDVTDTGIGMTDEDVGRLFQAFSQVDNSATRRFGGSGMGLFISKRLAEILGGNIEVQSTWHKGSTFTVTIDPGPLEEVRLITIANESVIQAKMATSVPIAKKIKLNARILLVEDGLDNQRLIQLLMKKAGAEVVAVENGQLAVEKALTALDANRPFDVILMDMQMPVMDGYTATRRLREWGYPGPIVALTAHAMAHDSRKCLDAGCDDYATKPVDKEKLLAIVAYWAARSQSQHGAFNGMSNADSPDSPVLDSLETNE
jgi:CheY-like chemotaxis protein